MEREEVFKRMEKVFSEVLDLKSVELSDNTNSDDYEEWDSLAHVQLINQIQIEFGVRFSAREMLGWENVGQMVDSILQKKS